MRISHKFKFVYINIPFNGADFVMEKFDKYSQIFGDGNNNSDYYCHTKPVRLKKVFKKNGWNWDEYLKIAVIRNPLDRIVNRHYELQKDKIDSEKVEFDHRIQHQLNWVNHQHHWTHDKKLNPMIDCFLRYERIQPDFDDLCEKLKLEKTKLKLPKKYNQFNHQEHYTDDIAFLCENHHNVDYELLNLKKYGKIHHFSKNRTNEDLPDFVIPGFQKCGTSALWTNLRKHPNLYMGEEKEINYFNFNYGKGLGWYKNHFKKYNNSICGDASINYLYDNVNVERNLGRMVKVIPNAKLIIALRNPITRAYSAYNHYMQNLEKSKNHRGWLLPGKTFEENILEEQKNNFETGIIQVGFYWDTLKKVFDFYPQEQILLLKQEGLLLDPESNYKKIYEFIGAPYKKLRYGYSHRRKYDNEMSDVCKKMLNEIYLDKNIELYKNVGIDYTNEI